MTQTAAESLAERYRRIIRWKLEHERAVREMQAEREVLRRERIEAAAKATHGKGGRQIVLAFECEPGKTRKPGIRSTNGAGGDEASPLQEYAIRVLEDSAA